MNIRVSLGTKFHLKLTILIFYTNFAQKGYFLVKNGKIVFLRAPMVVTYYIELFRTWTERRNGILMSILLLVAETVNHK